MGRKCCTPVSLSAAVDTAIAGNSDEDITGVAADLDSLSPLHQTHAILHAVICTISNSQFLLEKDFKDDATGKQKGL